MSTRRARDVFDGCLADEKVREDPNVVTPAVKETTIRFAKDEDRAHVATAEAGLIRRVLAHDEAVVKSLDLLREGHPVRGVEPEDYAGETVIGAVATLPVGALQIKSTSRKGDSHAEVVSDRVLTDEYGGRE